MKVLYDISALGLVQEYSAFKTGIARTVEALAYQLVEIKDCNLSLCSSEHLVGSLDYVANDPVLKEVPFPHSKAGASLQKTRRDTQRLVETSSGFSRITARGKRKLLRHFMSIAKISSETLTLDSLRSADIYHSTFLALPDAARCAKKPQLFLTVYDLVPILFPEHCQGVTNELFQRIVSSIDKDTWILSISEFTKIDLCSYLKIDPSRVFVTPLAADADLFYPVTDAQELARVRNKYAINPAPYVLSLCTIEPRKNIDHVIRCYVRLMQEGQTPDLQLVLAGAKGWDYDHIFAEIDGAETFKDNIVVTGFIANEDLASLYSGAMAFVYPSLYEGFGLPPLEAMQCGVPVITSNTSSLPEVVGEAGIMLDPKDADGLCGALLSLYEDSNLRREMAAKSLARAGLFSWQRCAEDTVQAYKTALAS